MPAIEVKLILENAVLILLLWMGQRLAPPLGAVIYAGISLTMLIPYIGKVFSFFLTSTLKFGSFVKLVGWSMSASGVLLGLIVYGWFLGYPDSNSEFIIILVLSSVFLAEILTKSMMFYDFGVGEFIGEASPILEKLSVEGNLLQDPQYRLQLHRSSVVDNTLIAFLNMLLVIGLIHYSLGGMGLFETIEDELPTMWESLYASLTASDLFGQPESVYQGQLWDLAGLVSSLLVFYWITIYFPMASSNPDIDLEVYKNAQEASSKPNLEVHEIMEELKQLIENSDGAAQSVQITWPPIRIVAALVNPKGKDEGNETVTLQNVANQAIALNEWKITDAQNNSFELTELSLEPKDTLTIKLDPTGQSGYQTREE